MAPQTSTIFHEVQWDQISVSVCFNTEIARRPHPQLSYSGRPVACVPRPGCRLGHLHSGGSYHVAHSQALQHIKGHSGRFVEMLSLRVSPPSSRVLLQAW